MQKFFMSSTLHLFENFDLTLSVHITRSNIFMRFVVAVPRKRTAGLVSGNYVIPFTIKMRLNVSADLNTLERKETINIHFYKPLA